MGATTLNTPVGINGAKNPTTGELAVSVSEHARRLKENEDTISETRKQVTSVERMLQIVNVKIEGIQGGLSWAVRLAFAVVVGVGGLVGVKIWELITAAGAAAKHVVP